MKEPISRVEGNGLRFFGRMSAAISHDLKNTLSIMNESAGLLEDLALLAEKGRALDPQRIQQLGAAIKRQIQRNDGIVRNMNRFAHSVDDPVKEIDLAASLETLLAICRRLTDARGVAVSVATSDPEVAVVTRPFHFYHLVWLLLEWGMDYAGPGKHVVLRIERDAASVRLACQGLESLTGEVAGQCPLPQWQDLLGLLDARIEIAADQQAIAAVLPLWIDG
jgi:signal transduction histidine kinase